MNFKPNLAAAIKDCADVQFPCYVSPKLDGIRCIVKNGNVLSRSLKPLPNEHIQTLLNDSMLNNFDGEIIVGEPTAPDVYNMTQSWVMSKTGEPDFTFWVFDTSDHDGSYERRLAFLEDNIAALQKTFGVGKFVKLLPHKLVNTLQELLDFEETCIEMGYEGICVRGKDSTYKCGRSTMREQGLMKLKRFTDAEATVVGFKEQMRNDNDAFTDELGRTKRSSAKDGKTGKDTLGALCCIRDNISFDIGSGLNDDQRRHIWANRERYLGNIVKFKFFNVGVKTAPRMPVFLGWRDSIDMSD